MRASQALPLDGAFSHALFIYEPASPRHTRNYVILGNLPPARGVISQRADVAAAAYTAPPTRKVLLHRHLRQKSRQLAFIH